MSIAKYSFLSWMRQGLGQYMVAPGSGQLRGKVSVEVKIKDGAVIPTQDFEVVGPGDIIGIDPRNIVRLHPEPNTGNFESNYLPFIEFYQDTFLWNYTPEQATGNKLRPWLFLLVLAEEEYTLTENPQGLDKISLNSSAGLFPPVNQSWAWAHVHVNADTTDLTTLKQKLDSNPDFAVSRLMSPRRLTPNTRYQAFVIPAFETGRKTGLGLDIDPNAQGFNSLASSWESGQNEFPVYYRWSFQTGLKGDFESLVRELVPRNELDPSIGFRPMDISEASSPYTFAPPTVQEVPLGGALKPVGSAPPDFPDTAWQVEVIKLLNKREGQQEPAFSNTANDPVIVPPTYGHWHALVSKLNAGNDTGPINDGDSIWLHTLNLDPANRVAAGVGTKVVQENQDKYLAVAWEQIGSVLEANQLIKQSQLGIEIAVRWWDKHITTQEDGALVSMLEPLLTSVLCPGNTISNVYLNIQASGTPTAAFSPTFRRLSNSRGRIVKKMKKNRLTKPHFVSIIQGVTNGLNIVPEKQLANGKENVITSNPNDVSTSTITLPAPCKPLFQIVHPNPIAIVSIPLPLIYLELAGGLEHGGPVNFPGIDPTQLLNTWASLSASFYCGPSPVQPPAVNLSNIVPCIKYALKPDQTIKDRVLTLIGTEAELDAIVPILAAPDYPEPMYKKLLEQSADFILPNLNKLPNNTITLMEANQAFIEAYMVGLNYEMARELIWNEYPTDQRGSYFRQFWDVSKYIVTGNPDPKELAEKLKDIDFIHRWIKWTDLGDHRMSNRLPTDPPSITPLVLTIRGDLLQRYPEAVIFAIKANPDGTFKNTQETKYPIFSAKIDPDITFLGFELSEDDVRGNGLTNRGWYFCIKEPSAGPRFGLDLAPDDNSAVPPTSWNELHWGHITNANLINLSDVSFSGNTTVDGKWGTDSANMASILYQVPVLVAIHGSQLLPQS